MSTPSHRPVLILATAFALGTGLASSSPEVATAGGRLPLVEYEAENATPTSALGTGLASSSPEVATAGARLPLVEYEAENATTDGRVLAPSTRYLQPAAEASGRSAVELALTGQYVEIVLAQPANAIDLRYSIPDTADGVGQDATLGMSIDGQWEEPLQLTSRYSHVYGAYPYVNDPSQSDQHRYFDTVRALLGRTVPAGTRIRFEVRPEDRAGQYLLDVVDTEVATPGPAPTNRVDVTAFGADPAFATDSTAAIQAAIDASAGLTVWVPAGHYLVTGHLTLPDGLTMSGAGSRYSVLEGAGVGLYGRAPSVGVHVSGLAVVGRTDHRVESTIDSGVGGALRESTVEDLWIQHTKTGIWLDGPSSGVTISRVRIADVFADGINLAGGITDSTIADTFVRGSGDDGIAMWSSPATDARNLVTRSTVSAPVLANAFAIYGGQDNAVTDSVAADTLTQGGGLHVGNRFGASALAGTTRLSGNVVLRSGAVVPNEPEQIGAIWFWAADSPITSRIELTDTTVLDSPWSVLQVYGSSVADLNVTNLSAVGVGTFLLQAQAAGAGTFSNVVSTPPGVTGVEDCNSGFTVTRDDASVGWSTTSCGLPADDTLTLSTSTLDFGYVDVGQEVTKQVVVTNRGPATVTVGGVFTPEAFTTTDDCTTLAAGQSCTVTVTYAPTSGRNDSGYLQIDSDSASGPNTVELTAIGVDPYGNLAAGRPTTASSAHPWFPAWQAVDGNPDSYWNSADDAVLPQWLTVDTGREQTVGRVTIQLPAGWGARTETVTVRTSLDGLAFVDATGPTDVLLDPGTGNVGTVVLPAGVTARYFQVVVSANTGWPAGQVSELGVYRY
jgi:hypothetical protein